MTLEIEVISDVICPWCYIGKRRLEKALNTLNNRDDIAVVWRPFQLNPTMPLIGMDRQAYRATKFGNTETARSRDYVIASIGATEGLVFDFDRIKRTPNTLNAHRLIWLADREKVQDVVVEALFQSYFIDGADISDRQTLVHIGGLAGLGERLVETFLKSDDGVADVREDDAQARQKGIQGVPCFMLAGKILLSGAQDTNILVEAIKHAALP